MTSLTPARAVLLPSEPGPGPFYDGYPAPLAAAPARRPAAPDRARGGTTRTHPAALPAESRPTKEGLRP